MTAYLPPMIRFQPLVAGSPLPGGKVYFYAAGTTTPQTAYAADGTTPIINPLVLDANGAGDFRLSESLLYKIDLTTSGDVPVVGWPIDQIGSEAAAALLRTDLASTATDGVGDALIGVKQPFAGAAGRTLHSWILGQDFTPEDFGAVGNGVADDTVAINAGILASGGHAFQFGNKSYLVTTLNVTAANTRLKFGPGTNLINTNTAVDTIVISADGCSIDGAVSGKITGPASWDGTNVSPTYATIKITGNKCRVENLVLVNIRRVGVWAKDVNEFTFTGNLLQGNYPVGQWTGIETVNYGLLLDPGTGAPEGNFRVTNNTFESTVQGIIAANYGGGNDQTTAGINITSNTFMGCWNHGIYLASSYGSVIEANSFVRCQFPIVAEGKYHLVNGNTLYTTATGNQTDITGISMRESIGCMVTNNIIIGDAPSTGSVIAFLNLAGDLLPNSLLNDNTCADNIILVTGGASVPISFGSSNFTTQMNNNTIARNRIVGAGKSNAGLITLVPQAAFAVTASIATNVLTVTASAGNVGVGQLVTGAGVPASTYIASLGTGTGGAGTYNLSTTPGTVASEAMTVTTLSQNNRIIDNDLTLSTTAVAAQNNLIHVQYSNGGEIRGNTVRLAGAATGAVTIYGVYAYTVTGCRIESNNIIADGTAAAIDDGKNILFRGIYEDSPCDTNIVRNNKFLFSATGTAFTNAAVVQSNPGNQTIVKGNTIGGVKNYGVTAAFPLAANNLVVTNANIQTTSIITLTAANADGAKLIAGQGLFVTPAAGNFTITTGDGANGAFAGTFNWLSQ